MQFVKQKWFYKKFSKRAKTIKLGLKNLYIFPNIYGVYWILTIIVLYILGTNLEVNFTIFLSYLMLAVFLISIFLTHFNLHGLELSTTDQDINFANKEINYSIIINSEKYRSNLRLKFLDQLTNYKMFKNINGSKKITINCQKKERGIHYPDVIYGESSAPLSLLNCWFYWQPSTKIIVAPEIKKGKLSLKDSSQDSYSNISNTQSIPVEELVDFKSYEKGEKKSLIFWKSLAKSKKLQTKIYKNKANKIKILQLDNSLPLEIGLKNLCFEVHDEYIKNNFYGINLENEINILPNIGYSHYFKCLYLLAKYKK
jgi:uncharacterized protein (DUF58 family)